MPSLATAYTLIFATFNLRNILFGYQAVTDYFKNIKPSDLATVSRCII